MSRDEILILYKATIDRINLAKDKIQKSKEDIRKANYIIARESKIMNDMEQLKEEYRAKLLLTIEDK